MPDLLCYTHKLTPRVKYALDVILYEMLGIEINITTDKEYFISYQSSKLSYTYKPLSDEFHITCTDLLFEKGVSEQVPSISEHNGVTILYKTSEPASALPFDVFAASFFLLSRYEECLPHLRDSYDRFEAGQSFSHKNGFMHRPVVDQWVIMLGRSIASNWPSIKLKDRKFRFISTIDIDNAYAYRLKGLMRTIGGFLRSAIGGDFNDIKHRASVLLGNSRDPYDTYNLQLSLQERYGFNVIYFFLLADYGLNDKNVPHYNLKFRSLIKHLADHAKVGIHPGFGSNNDHSKLKTEKERLENIVHSKVVRSRQHFLVLHLPHTYRRLAENGIMEDHTMGYATSTGFRAGTCTPYPFYDLDLEQRTGLMVYPFAIMDATLKYYMKLEPDQAIQHINHLIKSVKEVDGTFISLWHNDNLNDRGEWAGWTRVYEHLVRTAAGM